MVLVGGFTHQCGASVVLPGLHQLLESAGCGSLTVGRRGAPRPLDAGWAPPPQERTPGGGCSGLSPCDSRLLPGTSCHFPRDRSCASVLGSSSQLHQHTGCTIFHLFCREHFSAFVTNPFGLCFSRAPSPLVPLDLGGSSGRNFSSSRGHLLPADFVCTGHPALQPTLTRGTLVSPALPLSLWPWIIS